MARATTAPRATAPRARPDLGAALGTLVGVPLPVEVAWLEVRVLEPVELAADEVALVRVVAAEDEPELDLEDEAEEAELVAEALPLLEEEEEEEPELPSSSLTWMDLAEPVRSP